MEKDERMSRDALVNALTAAGASFRGNACRCVFHEDRHASAGIYQSDGGVWRYKCHACDAAGDIFDIRARLSNRPLKDVLPAVDNPSGLRRTARLDTPQGDAMSPLSTKGNKRGKLHATPEAAAKAAAIGLKRSHSKTYVPVAWWGYQDAGRLEVGRVYRFEVPGEGRSSKQYRPVYRDGSGWRIGDPPGGFPLYRLPELSSSSGPVIITEGEPAADALAELGLNVTTSAHGARSAHKMKWVALAGRVAYLSPDNDPPGRDGMVTGRKYTDEVAACIRRLVPPGKPKLLELPELPPKGDAVEFVQQRRERGQTDEEIRSFILELAEKAPDYPVPALESDAGERLPRVFLPGGARNVRISDSAAELGRLLSEREELFVHAGRPVRVATEGHERVRLISVAVSALPAIFEQVATLYTTKALRDGGIFEIPTNCSKQQAELIAECQGFLDALPAVRTLARRPVMTKWDGKLITVVGYHRPTGIYAGGSELEEVPLDEAVQILKELLQDYQFVTPADKSRVLAALVTPALLQGGLLPGRAPLTLFEADNSQSGKGYAAKLIAAIYGDQVRTVTQRNGGTGSLEESMSQYLLEGAGFISVDNVRGKLDSPALESALTEDFFLSRAPYTKPVSIDVGRTTFMMTSNKAELTTDLANRSNPIRLLKQPEGYQFKKYPGGRDVLEHVRRHQGRYQGAVFTIVRAWVNAACPRTTETRHDFRIWAQSLDWIVRNILSSAPLCDGVKDVKTRMTNPSLNWVREAAHTVLQSGWGHQWLRTNQIVSLSNESGVEVPGLSDEGDLGDEAVAKKAHQATGSRLARCFAAADRTDKDGMEFAVLRLDGMTIERRSQYDERERCWVRSYRFSPTAVGEDIVAASTQIGSLPLSSGRPSDTVEENDRGYCAAVGAATRAATETQCAATAAMGSEHFSESGGMTVRGNSYESNYPESMQPVAAQPRNPTALGHGDRFSGEGQREFAFEGAGSESEEMEWTF
jgi:hypothetical protein